MAGVSQDSLTTGLQEQISDARRLVTVALFAWPAFVGLDLLGIRLWNEGHGLSVVLAARAAGVAVLLPCYAVLRGAAVSARTVVAVDAIGCVALGGLVALIGTRLGGLGSRAPLVGIVLICTFRAAMFPSTWRRMLGVGLAATAAWPATLGVCSLFSPELRAEWSSSQAVGELAYGLLFAVSALGMSSAGCHALWSVRREVRERNRELSENRAELAYKVAQLETNNGELRHLNEELALSNHRADRIFSALAEALPGTVLDGKYQLKERIGAGGFGVVFRAMHLGLRRAVAVKVFRPTPGNDSAAALERFRREAISTCLVQHPNAVAVYDSGISNDQIAYLAMELLEGETLAARLARVKTLPVGPALAIAEAVCAALGAAHAQGIVHRDVKPENVFLHRAAGGEEIVKVVDFGIATLLQTSEAATLAKPLTATNVIIGTPAYVAPERIEGSSYDGRADVYSVAVLLYEMLTGHLPIEHEGVARGFAALVKQATGKPRPLRSWLPDAREELEALVMRPLARDPAKRPTATELAAEARRVAVLPPPRGE